MTAENTALEKTSRQWSPRFLAMIGGLLLIGSLIAGGLICRAGMECSFRALQQNEANSAGLSQGVDTMLTGTAVTTVVGLVGIVLIGVAITRAKRSR